MSNLWLLEAKAWPEDSRSEEARTAKFYLRPGTYTVGRQAKQCDIDVPDDKSISRVHAEIAVPATDWAPSRSPPHVTVRDTSRYGTLVTETNDMNPPGEVGAEAAPRHRWLIRFGYASPFRLHHLDWAAVLHPSCPPELAAKARSLGFELRTSFFTGAPATIVLIAPGPEVPLDGSVLAALLFGSPVVTPGYLEAWEARKVWKNAAPAAEDHLAAVAVGGGAALTQAEARGRMRAPAPDPLLMRGLKLLWHPAGEGDVEAEGLREVTAELCGAGAGAWPKTAAAAKKLAKGAVVVLNDSEADVAARPFLAGCRWTTREDVVAAVAAGSVEGLARPPQETQAEEKVVVVLADEADTPARRRKRGAEAAAEGAARPAARQRRASQQAAAEDAETDDEDEARAAKRGSVSLAATEPIELADSAAPPSVSKGASKKRGAGGPSPSKITSEATNQSPSAASKRRRSARAGAATLESEAAGAPSPPSVRPSPTKKSRGAGSPSSFVPETVVGPAPGGGAPSPASVQEPAAAVARPLPAPSGEGWHTVARAKRRLLSSTPSEQTQQRQLTSGAATTVAEGAAVTAVALTDLQEDAEGAAQETKGPKPAVDASAVVIDAGLVVVPPAAAAAAALGPRGFKAFRRKGDAVAGPGGSGRGARPIIPFDPEPYREGGVNDEDFAREEEERAEAARAADALFDAELKVKRDKKTMDAAATRLLALVPESARRRGGRKS